MITMCVCVCLRVCVHVQGRLCERVLTPGVRRFLQARASRKMNEVSEAKEKLVEELGC
jgi:hypothetical protein